MKILFYCFVATVLIVGCKAKKNAANQAIEKQSESQATQHKIPEKQQNIEEEITEEKSVNQTPPKAPNGKEQPAYKGEEPDLYRMIKINGTDFRSLPQDPFTLKNAYVIDNMLYTEVTYSGGCTGANFQLAWNGMMMKSLPPKVVALLSFDDKDDCEAMVTKKIVFELDVLKEAGNEVILILQPGDKQFKVTF